MSPAAFGASVQGRAHARLGRNSQDGWALAGGPGRAVAVVTDGCGSRPRSEVGAVLGARYLARWLAGSAPLDEALPERAGAALAGFLGRVAGELGGGTEDLDACFLFTFLALVREGPRVSVFGLGDGALLVDGALTRLDAGPLDAPEYLAYRLGGGGPRPPVQQHFLGEARVAAVMTDGLGELPAAAVGGLLEGVEGWRNPFTLQRRLTLLHQARPFADDATLVVAGGG